MRGKKGQESNLAFVGKLIIAAFSLIIIVFVGLTFVSIFVPVKLDIAERIDIIETGMSRSIENDDYNIAVFDLNRHEFMVVYLKDYSHCGLKSGESWPEIEEEEIGVCIGPKDADSRSIESQCTKLNLRNNFEEEETIHHVRLGMKNLLGFNPKGISHTGTGWNEGLCIEHDQNVISYRMEMLRSQGGVTTSGQNTLRVDVY